MDLKRLEIFYQVVEQKSFSRAAEKLRISQPSVSEHMRLLEESLNERLLDRLGREVQPTPAGRILLPYARRLLSQRDEALQALKQFRGELCGDITIGASTIPGNYLLPSLLAKFKQQHPDVHITLQIAASEKILQRVQDGEYEIGVVGVVKDDPRLVFETLVEDRLLLAMPTDHPLAGSKSVTLKDLAEHPLLVRETGSGTRRTLELALKQAGMSLADLDVVAELGSPEAIRQGVRAGIGIAVLSSLAIAEELQRQELTTAPVASLDLRRVFSLVKHTRRQLSPVAATLVDFLGSPGEAVAKAV